MSIVNTIDKFINQNFQPLFLSNVNAEKTDNGTIIRIDAPGVTVDGVTITRKNDGLGDGLEITTKRVTQQGSIESGYFQPIRRTLETKQIQAQLINGVLSIYLPKTEKDETVETISVSTEPLDVFTEKQTEETE